MREVFYVFYDEKDFVKCCGTAKELVAEGHFPTCLSVNYTASKIRNKKQKGFVVTLPLEGD